MNKISFAQTAVLAAAALFSGCAKTDTAQPAKGGAPVVEVALPQKRMVEVWDQYTARFFGENVVQIHARVSGYLEKRLFKDGEYVKEGQPLFIIDPRPFEAVVKECEASIKECESRIVLAKSNLARAEELIKTNAISVELLETRKCELLAAEAMLMSAQAKLREAQLNLEFTTIKAPVSGYMSKREIDAGNLVTAGTGTPLASIVSRDIVYADFFISERDVLRYNRSGLFKKIDREKHTGPTVRMQLLDETSPSHEGMLTYVSNNTDTGNFELRAEFKNDDDMIIPGIMGKVFLKSQEPTEKLLVPEAAIGTDLVSRYVLVVGDNNKVVSVPVIPGELHGNMQVVEKGLNGNERIVVNGIQRAVPGTVVTPVEKGQSPAPAPEAAAGSAQK